MEEEEAQRLSSPLPGEIWVEIFNKLPLVFLSNSLFVCKQWSRLISNPLFSSNYNPNSIPNHPITLLLRCWCRGLFRSLSDIIFLHQAYNKSITENGVGCFAKSDSLERRPLRPSDDFFNPHSRHGEPLVSMFGSCNGLVGLYRSPGHFLLFNPCTKVEKRVHFDIEKFYDESLGNRVRLKGLCYDPVGDKYKVVMCDSRTNFSVLSLKDGSFKHKTQSQVLQKVSIGTRSRQMMIIRGVVYWDCELRSGGGNTIIYFDPLVEEIQMIPFPKTKRAPRKGQQPELGFELGALDGKLTLSLEVETGHGIMNYCPMDHEVWTLDETNSWSMLFVIDKDCNTFGILSWVSDHEILVQRQYVKVYNIRDRVWNELLLCNGFHTPAPYIPSLVSPNN